MQVKIHQTGARKIISICDKNLIGKKFEEKDLQLDVSEYFYKGDILDKKTLLKEIETAASLNIVGKDSISFALKQNLISKQNIIKIQNIPYALVIIE